jgi:hypothetical protein
MRTRSAYIAVECLTRWVVQAPTGAPAGGSSRRGAVRYCLGDSRLRPCFYEGNPPGFAVSHVFRWRFYRDLSRPARFGRWNPIRVGGRVRGCRLRQSHGQDARQWDSLRLQRLSRHPPLGVHAIFGAPQREIQIGDRPGAGPVDRQPQRHGRGGEPRLAVMLDALDVGGFSRPERSLDAPKGQDDQFW